jgi:DNA mismatch repair ATPase MutS
MSPLLALLALLALAFVASWFQAFTFRCNLYRRYAAVGCAELDWKMTVSGVGHCRQVGCPESGVDAAVAALVGRGYKVGRIEQMETAAQAKARVVGAVLQVESSYDP